MRKEPEITRVKPLEELTLSPNPGLEHLEKTLGIYFPLKPVAVELSPQNKKVLRKTDGMFNQLGRTVVGIILDGLAYYDLNFHAYFFKPGENNLLVSAHENMHGFTHMENPHIEDHMLSSSNEKVAASRCFDEGIAHWAAVEALYRTGDYESKKQAIEERNLMLFGRGNREDFMQGQFDKIKKAIDAKESARRGISIGSGVMGIFAETAWGFIERVRSEVIFSKPQYFVGYYFVYHAMHQLVDKEHMTTADAIKFLIHHPPKNLGDLAHPEGYVQRAYFFSQVRSLSFRRSGASDTLI